MSWFDRTVSWLFPRLLLSDTPWRSEWELQQRDAFISSARLFFPTAALIYIAHYHFFDVPMELEPARNWLIFRYSIATLCLAATAYYLSRFCKVAHYKLVAGFVCAAFCFSQAQVVISYGKEAWVFCFVLVAISVQVLQEPVANSIAISTMLIVMMCPALIQAGTPLASILSGSLATLAMVFALRSTYIKDVRNYLLNKEYLVKQDQLNELNREFSDRVRSFIPTVISSRLEDYVNNHRMSVIEASIEVLRAQEKPISCVFSDIRGYTKNSGDLELYIRNSVIPEMRVCSNIVENNEGIPRKIGDLLFAYFDHRSQSVNALRAVASGLEISVANKAMNDTHNDKQIDRYILVASGHAVVGNIGGVDSAVEITALGSPVNFLSRLDELTKTPALKAILQFGDILVCRDTHRLLLSYVSQLDAEHVDLTALNLAIRDFPDTKQVVLVKPTEDNLSAVKNALSQLGDVAHHEGTSRFRKIA